LFPDSVLSFSVWNERACCILQVQVQGEVYLPWISSLKTPFTAAYHFREPSQHFFFFGFDQHCRPSSMIEQHCALLVSRVSLAFYCLICAPSVFSKRPGPYPWEFRASNLIFFSKRCQVLLESEDRKFPLLSPPPETFVEAISLPIPM